MIRLARPQKLLTQRTVLIRNAFTFFMIFISEYFFNSVDYEVFHTIVSTATHIAIWYRFERDQNEGLMYAREQTCFVRKFLAEVLIPHFYVVFMTMPRFSKNSIPYHRCSLSSWLKLLTIYFSSKFRYVKQVAATSPFLDVFEIWYGITMLQHVEIQWLIFTGKCAKCETVILPTNFNKLKISQIILAGKLMEQIREVHHIFVYVVYV